MSSVPIPPSGPIPAPLRATHTLEFDAVHVIESLPWGETATGHDLYTNVLEPRTRTVPGFAATYVAAPTRATFLQALENVRAHAERGGTPILHLESHGDPDGILLADRSGVPWEELREVLTAINVATRCNLLVVTAMCHGAYLARILRPTQPTPAWGVLGPEVSVGDLSLYKGMAAHHPALLEGVGGDAALTSLNAAQSNPAWRYYLRTAEELFHYALDRFFAERSPEDVADQERELMAYAVLKAGGDIEAETRARNLVKQRLNDAQFLYDRLRPHFLMLDRFPENASRFTMTFEAYHAWQAVNRAAQNAAAATPASP